MSFVKLGAGSVSVEDIDVADRIADTFKEVVVKTGPSPVITDALRSKYLGHFVAYSLETNIAEWGDKGSARSRINLSDQMDPLVCGKDYYVHPIE
jgi:hypothetical protein